jgi:hypothetical protein
MVPSRILFTASDADPNFDEISIRGIECCRSIFDGNDCGDLEIMSISGPSGNWVWFFYLYRTAHLIFLDSWNDQI